MLLLNDDNAFECCFSVVDASKCCAMSRNAAIVVIISWCVSGVSTALRAEEVKRVGTSSGHEGVTKSSREFECEPSWRQSTGPADRVSFAGTFDTGSVLTCGIDAEGDNSETAALPDADSEATVSASSASVDRCIASSSFLSVLRLADKDEAGRTTASKAELRASGGQGSAGLKARGRMSPALSGVGKQSPHVES